MNSSRLHPIDRRRFLSLASVAATATFLDPRALFAQAPATASVAPPQDAVAAMRASGATAKITTHPLRRNLSVLMGSGGNIVVLPGKEGKLLVDSGFSTSQAQITEALAALSHDPLTHLIDTHWHFDHTDGNEWMHTAGATIIAHENTLKRLSSNQEIAAFHATFPPAPEGARPTHTPLPETTSSTSTTRTSNSATTPPPTRIPTSPFTSLRLTSCTPETPGSTAPIPSSITPPEATSTASSPPRGATSAALPQLP